MKIIGKTTFSLLFLLVATLLTASQSHAQERMTRAEYIAKWRHIAIDNMETYGIPASITMAQGLLESGAGNSELARKSNNHFGIKCKSTWTGDKVYHDDDAKGECFRAYPTVEESYEDHAEFLNVNKRYESLFAYDITDYKSWAHGLKAAGYATAPDYAERLIKLIEEEHLYLLDQTDGTTLYDNYMADKLGITTSEPTPKSGSEPQPAPQPAPTVTRDMTTAYSDRGIDPDNFRVTINSHHGYNVYKTNGAHYIIAKEGDDYAKLGKLFEMSASTLRRFNDVGSATEPSAGDIVYIERKSARWKGSNLLHTVTSGETLHTLSQVYGVRLDQLSKLNRIRPSDPLSEQQTIKLR